MDDRSKELARSILKRAIEEGREGRARMILDRLKAARDMPDDHRRILREITLFGKVLPTSPFSSRSLH